MNDRRQAYEDKAREQYRDVIDLFHEQVTINSDIEHTGGGCLAIRVWLGADWYALVTTDEDVLPAPRPHGWCVGLYSALEEHGDRAGCDGWVLYESTDPDAAKMVAEVAPLLCRIASGEPVPPKLTLFAVTEDERELLDCALELATCETDELEAMRLALRAKLTQRD